MEKYLTCPACEEAGYLYVLHKELHYYSTCGPPYPGSYDEFYTTDGKFHWHINKPTIDTYVCSNKHNIKITSYDLCPSCDYNTDKPKIVEIIDYKESLEWAFSAECADKTKKERKEKRFKWFKNLWKNI